MAEETHQEDSLRLDNQICFRLYAASRLITKLYTPLLDQMDLTYPQYLVMLVLWEEDNIEVKAIGEKLYLNSNTLTPLLKKLEARELLIRTRSQEDERHVLIKLTEKGRTLRQRCMDIPEEMYYKLVESGEIHVNELTSLKELLDTMIRAVK